MPPCPYSPRPRRRKEDGSEEIIFSSAADLIFKTPRFYQGATKRLRQDLGGCYNYIERHFGGQNIYFDELEKNINHAKAIAVGKTQNCDQYLRGMAEFARSLREQ